MTTAIAVYRNEFRHGEAHRYWQAGAARRLNVGSGQYPLCYFQNLDSSPNAIADIYATVPPLPMADASLDEIYCGHFLEHLERPQQHMFLDECYRCLTVGGTLGIVVPDFREVMRCNLAGEVTCDECAPGVYLNAADLDSVSEIVAFSYCQESQHKWIFDLQTLTRLVESHGFRVTGEIDRFHDPRLGSGAWYQCGIDAVKI